MTTVVQGHDQQARAIAAALNRGLVDPKTRKPLDTAEHRSSNGNIVITKTEKGFDVQSNAGRIPGVTHYSRDGALISGICFRQYLLTIGERTFLTGRVKKS